MTHNFLRLLYSCLPGGLILSMLLLVQGCSDLPVQQLPPELSLVKIGTGESGLSFAPSPDNVWLALADNGLHLRNLKTSQKRRLSSDTPAALAWNPSGNRLTAAFSRSGRSTLQVFATDGEATSQTGVDGMISDIVWGSDEVLIFASITLESYSFGSTLLAKLWQWDRVTSPVLITESSVTVKPRTVKILGKRLYTSVHLSVSPLGDEILYTRLHDPPAVRPYMKILLRHLETGSEREVAQAAPTMDNVFLLNGDMVLYSNGTGMIRQLDPWTRTIVREWQADGHKLAASVSGQYILTDGQLFDGPTKIAAFSPDVDGFFSADNTLFIRDRNRLYSLSGLNKVNKNNMLSEKRRQLLEIRKWRSQELITQQEFLVQKKKILEQ